MDNLIKKPQIFFKTGKVVDKGFDVLQYWLRVHHFLCLPSKLESKLTIEYIYTKNYKR